MKLLLKTLSLSKTIILLVILSFTLTSCVTSIEKPYNSRRMDLVVNNTSDDMFSNAYASKFLIPSHKFSCLLYRKHRKRKI